MKHSISRVYMFLIIVSMMSVICFCGTVTASGKTVKSTVYHQVIKTGDSAYCNCDYGICKVNLKTGEVTWLLKLPKSWVGISGYGYMKIEGEYLYYENRSGSAYTTSVNRINLRSKENQVLARSSGMDSKKPYYIISYAIKDCKLYVSGYKVNWVMELNGESKEKSSARIILTHRKSNKKGYSIIQKGDLEEKGYAKWYLKKPNGERIYLAKVKN